MNRGICGTYRPDACPVAHSSRSPSRRSVCTVAAGLRVGVAANLQAAYRVLLLLLLLLLLCMNGGGHMGVEDNYDL